jgi:hypothetical protein
MTAEQEGEVAARPALHRRAIVRALASSPVILTISGTAARAQQSFGTSLCEPFGLRMIISDPTIPQGARDAAEERCRALLGGG